MIYHVAYDQEYTEVSIAISGSKSISNRLLILQALCSESFILKNLATSEDTRAMMKALNERPAIIDIGHAGTAMRFLTAYLSVIPGMRILTGSERMLERPIEKVVSALQELGADIKYLGRTGYPPLEITGTRLKGGDIAIDGGVSSQYISALMMIAPTLEKGLQIVLQNTIVSRSYIELTAGLMKACGVHSKWVNDTIIIEPQKYISKSIYVEPDWSSASYWYAIAALANQTDIFLKGFHKESLQGDAAIVDFFKNLGVGTKYESEGIRLKKIDTGISFFEEDFLNTPDMVQTFAVVLVMKKIPFRISGTQSLRIKETDRIIALQQELGKFGADIQYNHGTLSWDGNLNPAISNSSIRISTYNDHRMALAFAPAALLCNGIEIEDPQVVIKSYPSYWDDLRKAGFKISEIS